MNSYPAIRIPLREGGSVSEAALSLDKSGLPTIIFTFLGMRKLQELDKYVRTAVSFYWKTRDKQASAQLTKEVKDTGLRTAVTGGKQMDGFVALLSDLIQEAGIPFESIHFKSRIELPGYFRPTKEWDLVVVHEGKLVVVIECKSQVGPSFGNNFNNRTEEAMGSALDLWTAFKKDKFNSAVRPWLGYTFLLEECPKSRSPVKVEEPHFAVFPEFKGASYARRYELFSRRLVLENLYTSAAFMLSTPGAANTGDYAEPAADLRYERFARSLVGHCAATSGKIAEL